MARTKKERRTFFRLWRFGIFFVLPALGYFLFAYLYNYYAGDIAHRTAAEIFRYAALAVDAVFPYLSIGLACTVIARGGFAGNSVTFFLGLASQLMPHLCEIFKNILVSPTVRGNLGAYLESAAAYTAVNFLADGAVYLTLTLLAFLFYRKCAGTGKRVISALVTVAAVLLVISLGLNVMDTRDFLYEQRYEYYNPITAKTVFDIVLTYLRAVLIAAVGFLLSAGQVYLLRGRKTK